MGEDWSAKEVEVIENCSHDCSNPVIAPAKAGHFSDLETQMLSSLCLSPLLLLLFSLIPAPSHSLDPASLNVRGWSRLCRTLNSQSSHTHIAGSHFEFRQNKRGFSPTVLELLALLMHLNVFKAERIQVTLRELAHLMFTKWKGM